MPWQLIFDDNTNILIFDDNTNILIYFQAIIKVIRTGPNSWYIVQKKKKGFYRTVGDRSLDGENKRNLKLVGHSPVINSTKGSREIQARGWSHSSACHVS
ncbi:hypothetical protein EUGRSUZ_F01012 [Eucalyptus grandis]|uniref:Uncharacterized protein n=2 Tax=Eucalyptus grandis TaxID=71139 RepID=A0ACC3KCX1_EUCGR|nr:hypothetical protein EUGRSUZ_F01012 [Eucalyptus grandis]